MILVWAENAALQVDGGSVPSQGGGVAIALTAVGAEGLELHGLCGDEVEEEDRRAVAQVGKGNAIGGKCPQEVVVKAEASFMEVESTF